MVTKTLAHQLAFRSKTPNLLPGQIIGIWSEKNLKRREERPPISKIKKIMKGAIADTRDERENKGDGNGIELLDRLWHAMCYRADDRRGGEETLTDEREKSASPIFQDALLIRQASTNWPIEINPAGPGRAAQ